MCVHCFLVSLLADGQKGLLQHLFNLHESRLGICRGINVFDKLLIVVRRNFVFNIYSITMYLQFTLMFDLIWARKSFKSFDIFERNHLFVD